MKAKKKPIEKISPTDLGVDLTPRLETLKISEPAKRVGGGKVKASEPFLIYTIRQQLIFLLGGIGRRTNRKTQGGRFYCSKSMIRPTCISRYYALLCSDIALPTVTRIVFATQFIILALQIIGRIHS